MSLPRVSIRFKNGQLGAVEQLDDAVTGLVASAAAVSDTFALGSAYLITRYDDLSSLGVDKTNNARLEKAVREFYDEAPTGTKLWIMGVAKSVSVTDICDKTEPYAMSLVRAANGAIRTLIVAKDDEDLYTPTMQGSLDDDLYDAMVKAQGLADESTGTLQAPLLVLLEGRHYNGTPSGLIDLTTDDKNRVAVVVGDTAASSKGACVGLIAGRIAAIPVQRSVARVKSGSIKATDLYLGALTADQGKPDVISDLGYITPRTFVGKSGYFWSDDKIATAPTDDYALIPRRRVIDKAYRVAYITMVNTIGEEIPITSEGKIPASICKSLQQELENAIENTMTVNGNLATDETDPNDTGVKCYIDPDQNIVQTSILEVSLSVRPYGYAKYIDINLGFQTT